MSTNSRVCHQIKRGLTSTDRLRLTHRGLLWRAHTQNGLPWLQSHSMYPKVNIH